MSSPLRWTLKLFMFSIIIIFASLYWAELGSTWVAIQLILVAVPLVLVQLQTKDAEGRAIKAPTRKPNPWIIGSSIRYSQTGGRLGLFFAIIAGTLIAAADADNWWSHVGLTNMRQLAVVRLSMCVALYYLFAYVCRRWPDEPTEENKA